jgi:hypothetical protein
MGRTFRSVSRLDASGALAEHDYCSQFRRGFMIYVALAHFLIYLMP